LAEKQAAKGVVVHGVMDYRDDDAVDRGEPLYPRQA